MTIPKNAGLSRLAEAASPIEYYPVKRRGTKRRLVPNWDAIRWLEDETEGDTEISDVSPLGDGMNRQLAMGWFSAKRRGMYPRRMFDIFELELSSTTMVAYTPCEACDNYAYTWACTEHPEVPWDTEQRVWVRHVSGDLTACYCTSCHERRGWPADPEPPQAGTDGLRLPEGLYDRMIEMFGQPLPSPGFTVRQADQEAYRRQAALYYFQEGPPDPNADRPGYHYHFPTDRWVPDTDFRAGGEVGAGFLRAREVSFDEVSADEQLASEWERQNGIPLADAVRAMRDGMNPFTTSRTRIGPPLGDLPDASITIEGTFGPGILEIISDTTEASARSVRIEVERDGDTP